MLSVLPVAVSAQQNLFNVPSGDITQKSRFFFQQQFNIGAHAGNSITMIDYGLGNNLEIGVNLFNLGSYPSDNGIHNPNVLVNFQKAFEINKS